MAWTIHSGKYGDGTLYVPASMTNEIIDVQCTAADCAGNYRIIYAKVQQDIHAKRDCIHCFLEAQVLISPNDCLAAFTAQHC